jgi:LEA14-like dessication related protein
MKGFKIFLGVAVALGGFAFIKYLMTQAKLLKDICVRSTSLEWREVIVDAVKAQIQGQTPNTSLPLELEIVNGSDVEVEVKDINFDIFFDGIHIGDVLSQQSAILGANSISTLELDVDLDLKGDILDLGLSILAGDNEVEIYGNILMKASIYEEYNYPYQIKVKGNNILKQVSGNCDL